MKTDTFFINFSIFRWAISLAVLFLFLCIKCMSHVYEIEFDHKKVIEQAENASRSNDIDMPDWAKDALNSADDNDPDDSNRGSDEDNETD